MRLHPLIANTVALWQLQSDFNDTSGNALHMVPVTVPANAPTTPPPFSHLSNKTLGVVTNDPCLMGVDFDGGASKLMAPVTPLLQMVGPCTFEWLYVQKFTSTHPYFCCADPAGRSGGAAPDRIGSLYTGWSINGDAEVADKKFSGSIPSAAYGWMGNSNATWARLNTPNAGDWHAQHMAYVRDGSGNWKCYLNGSVSGAGVLSNGTNVAVGNEQFFLGAIERETNTTAGLIASFRVLNYARAVSDILADATACLGACPAALSYRGVRIRLDNHR